MKKSTPQPEIIGKRHVRLQVDIENYGETLIKARKPPLRREIVLIDDSDPVQIDSNRIAPVFNNLRSKDFKYYFYVLAHLERNDKPVRISNKEMKIAFRDSLKEIVYEGLQRLCAAGLLFKVEKTRELYIVNPVYAWKGNRLDYLNTDEFPLVRD